MTLIFIISTFTGDIMKNKKPTMQDIIKDCISDGVIEVKDCKITDEIARIKFDGDFELVNRPSKSTGRSIDIRCSDGKVIRHIDKRTVDLKSGKIFRE